MFTDAMNRLLSWLGPLGITTEEQLVPVVGGLELFLALPTIVALLSGAKAAYGRYFQEGNWGPLMNGKLAWIVQVCGAGEEKGKGTTTLELSSRTLPPFPKNQRRVAPLSTPAWTLPRRSLRARLRLPLPPCSSAACLHAGLPSLQESPCLILAATNLARFWGSPNTSSPVNLVLLGLFCLHYFHRSVHQRVSSMSQAQAAEPSRWLRH